ncbi:hypothetical protein ACTA71_006580 [Dictyostelium dimigraforme]
MSIASRISLYFADAEYNIDHSLLIIQNSSLTIHHSHLPFAIYHSPFTISHLLFIIHHSPLATHYSSSSIKMNRLFGINHQLSIICQALTTQLPINMMSVNGSLLIYTYDQR